MTQDDLSHDPAAAPAPGLEELDDPDLRQEIALVTELVLAAARSHGPLTSAEIDQALGLR